VGKPITAQALRRSPLKAVRISPTMSLTLTVMLRWELFRRIVLQVTVLTEAVIADAVVVPVAVAEEAVVVAAPDAVALVVVAAVVVDRGAKFLATDLR